MRIGIMLRHMEQHGGGVYNYTHYLLNELLKLEDEHEFILIYKYKDHIGKYGYVGSNVKEIAIETKLKLVWDQFIIPHVARKENLDIIFNPKYSAPLLTKRPTVWVCHGLDWFVMPWGSEPKDRITHKILVPAYAKKAAGIIAVSNITKEHVIEYLNKKPEDVKRIYLGLHPAFKKKYTNEELNTTKEKYKLPDKFFLYVGQIYPPKNFGRLLKAYAKIGPRYKISLVIAGEQRWADENYSELICKLNISDWLVQPGWIHHETLAHFYSLAEALLLPSLYEACPSPVLEAMASGCSLITANRFGTKELAGKGALLVDPENIDSIAEGMEKILIDINLKRQLIEEGYKQVQGFEWKKCAKETLEFLENIAGQSRNKK